TPRACQNPEALLAGLIHCQPCGCAMTPAHSTKGTKRYRYYTCTRAQARGRRTCPSKSVPAHVMEQYIQEQVKRQGDAWPPPELGKLEHLRQVVERIDYNGTTGRVTIKLRQQAAAESGGTFAASTIEGSLRFRQGRRLTNADDDGEGSSAMSVA